MLLEELRGLPLIVQPLGRLIAVGRDSESAVTPNGFSAIVVVVVLSLVPLPEQAVPVTESRTVVITIRNRP